MALPLTLPESSGSFIGRHGLPLDPVRVSLPPDDAGPYFTWRTGKRRQASQLTANIDAPDVTAADERLRGDVILERSSPIGLPLEAVQRRGPAGYPAPRRTIAYQAAIPTR